MIGACGLSKLCTNSGISSPAGGWRDPIGDLVPSVNWVAGEVARHYCGAGFGGFIFGRLKDVSIFPLVPLGRTSSSDAATAPEGKQRGSGPSVSRMAAWRIGPHSAAIFSCAVAVHCGKTARGSLVWPEALSSEAASSRAGEDCGSSSRRGRRSGRARIIASTKALAHSGRWPRTPTGPRVRDCAASWLRRGVCRSIPQSPAWSAGQKGLPR